MTRRGALLTGVLTAAALLASGGVVASALRDAPQDARPAQDPTAALNRQTPVPPTPVAPGPTPVEGAPAGDPAPAAPVAITPPAPMVIEPLVEEKKAEEVAEIEESAPAPKVEPAGPPGVRQRRRVAIVQAIDKVTAETMRFEVEVGGRPVRFARTLIFTAKACEVSAPDELTEDSVAYLEVSLQPRGVARDDEPRQIFRGWMFASAPAVSGLQHPVYDAWVIGCKA
jgi:hypothetical protein